MKKTGKINRCVYFAYSYLRPVWDPPKTVKSILEYPRFVRDLIYYKKMENSGKVNLLDSQPCLLGKTKTSSFDAHYFYQDIWATKKILESKTPNHIDIGSRVDFVGFLSSFVNVTFVDIRPLEVGLENFNSLKGNILSLPFEDNSISSLSCLHVAEHIGLGRYGDKLDPLGTEKACRELARVLARGGDLYFSLPVGKPKTCFNAHRIHAPGQIINYFKGLELVEFSGINDNKEFKKNIDTAELENGNYACGLFWFKK